MESSRDHPPRPSRSSRRDPNDDPKWGGINNGTSWRFHNIKNNYNTAEDNVSVDPHRIQPDELGVIFHQRTIPLESGLGSEQAYDRSKHGWTGNSPEAS